MVNKNKKTLGWQSSHMFCCPPVVAYSHQHVYVHEVTNTHIYFHITLGTAEVIKDSDSPNLSNGSLSAESRLLST